jgi:predicted RNase H-like nuclease
MSAPQWATLSRIAEVDSVIAPYWQRTVFEVHPELSFFQLNDDTRMQYSKHTMAGRAERRALLETKLPEIGRVLDAPLKRVRAHHLIDAAACLWTARRIASRGITRLPEDPEWDDAGLRMEIVR